MYGGGGFVAYTFTAAAGQDTFVLNGVITPNVRVFSDGIRVRDTDYTVTVDRPNFRTTFVFNQPRVEHEEIIFETYTKITGEADYDAVDGQTIFVVPDAVFGGASVYVEGILISKNKYLVYNDGTNTTVEFNNGLSINDWVHISY
jgi:hypothetical protein